MRDHAAPARFLACVLIWTVSLTLSASAEEWWETRGCKLASDPKYVQCPPDEDADPSEPALRDFHLREPGPGLGIMTGRRYRERNIEEFLTRDKLKSLTD